MEHSVESVACHHGSVMLGLNSITSKLKNRSLDMIRLIEFWRLVRVLETDGIDETGGVVESDGVLETFGVIETVRIESV